MGKAKRQKNNAALPGHAAGGRASSFIGLPFANYQIVNIFSYSDTFFTKNTAFF